MEHRVRDIKRDWQRWSRIERYLAVAIVLGSIIGVPSLAAAVSLAG
jgi:hypothetical protein